MVRRLFLTPPALPLTTANRCIEIPDDKAWLGIFNKALLQAAQAFNYEQVNDTDLTPEDVAAVWYDIYVATLESNCMDCNDCFTGDFGLDDDLMYRVVDDVPQFSADGGTTWSDLPPGGSASPSVPALTATPGADEDTKACLAATRATLTLASLYQQTAGKAAVDLYSAFTTMAQFLSDVNRALFRLIWPDYYAVVNITGLFDCAACEGYLLSEPTLDSEAQDIIRCLLYENASVSAGGIVTFDFTAVQDNLISELGVNPGTTLFFLFAYLGGDGLNRAGNVAVTDTPADCDCTSILPYCVDFNTENAGYSLVALGSWPAGFWRSNSGEGNSGCIETSGDATLEALGIEIVLEEEVPVGGVLARFYNARSASNAYNRVVRAYDAEDVMVFELTGAQTSIQNTWIDFSVGINENVKRVEVGVAFGSGGGFLRIDNLCINPPE